MSFAAAAHLARQCYSARDGVRASAEAINHEAMSLLVEEDEPWPWRGDDETPPDLSAMLGKPPGTVLGYGSRSYERRRPRKYATPDEPAHN